MRIFYIFLFTLDTLHVSYVDDMHLLLYSCGQSGQSGCDRGWISGYARHQRHDQHLEEEFNTTQSAMCMEYKVVYNTNQYGKETSVRLLTGRLKTVSSYTVM